MSTPAPLATSPNRAFGVVVGIIVLLIGLVGFFIVTPLPFATTQGAVLIGLFGLNALQCTIHVVLGAALLLAALYGATLSKIVNVVAGIALFAWGVFGVFFDHTSANIFALNAASTFVHFAAAIVLLIVGLAADKLVVKSA